MIDHLLGRPSPSWKRIQVLLVSVTWFFYLYRTDRRGPAFFHKWNRKLSSFSPFQLVAGTLALLYMLKNVDRLVGLGAPEPLARLYSRSYYRATWILTALDAGFWTAMPIRPKWFKDIMSIVFSFYYLIFADQADEKTRRVRATTTIEHMRTSWEKILNPYLNALSSLMRPRLNIHQKKISIPRPRKGSHSERPITGYIYYAGDEESFKRSDRLILHFPGGGFISMPPPCHEDYLACWAKWTGIPIVSIDYAKAPEYPYPYALEECFDVYRSIMESNGKAVGMSGWQNSDGSRKKQIKVTLVGDSSGGNLVTAVMIKILEYSGPQDDVLDEYRPLAHPSALVLIYPCLNFDISCWMPRSHLSVIRAESTEKIPGILESKDHLQHKSPLAVKTDVKKRRRWPISSSADERTIEDRVQVKGYKSRSQRRIGTRLTMTSRMSFFNDRILTPDMMRAMAILYIGPNESPKFDSEPYLSPIVASDELLAQFPKTYMMCGEKDPFVDDTIIFAGRIREAKRSKGKQEDGGISFRMSSMDSADSTTYEDAVEVQILEGISHAFLQMLVLLPESKGAARSLARWLTSSFKENPNANKSKVDQDEEDLSFDAPSRIDQDEGLSLEALRSTNKHQRPNRINLPFDSSLPTDKTHLHQSHSSSEIVSANENGHVAQNLGLHISASEAMLTPRHEQEQKNWEQKVLLRNENEVYKRRRERLVSGLREGCETDTLTSDSPTVTKSG